MARPNLITQIGGKYSPDNPTLFQLKSLLISVGVNVTHPLGSDYFKLPNGRVVAYDPMVHRETFHAIETDYYESIRLCTFHWIANSQCDAPGRVGVSAGVELCWAMLHSKAIFATAPLWFAGELSPVILSVLTRNVANIHVLEIESSDTKGLFDRLSQATRPTGYDISSEERNFIISGVSDILDSISREEQSHSSPPTS